MACNKTSFTVQQIPPGTLTFDAHECEVRRKCPDTPKDGKFSKGKSLLWLELFPMCTDSGTGAHWKTMAKEFHAQGFNRKAESLHEHVCVVLCVQICLVFFDSHSQYLFQYFLRVFIYSIRP